MSTMELPVSLATIYAVYEDFLAKIPFACVKGCSVCCTRTVTMTTLEALPIASFLEKMRPDLALLVAEQGEKIQTASTDGDRALLTTNSYAGYFLARTEPPVEEVSPWCFDPCIFLEHGCCTLYHLRPFGCRSFGSMSRCVTDGAAELPPFVITVNTVLMQIIEDLDSQGGSWGRMSDVLASMIGKNKDAAGQLVSTMPLPGFLVPQEEKRAINVLLHRLHAAGLADWSAFLEHTAP